ncbi:MAG: hypothetical protein WCP28_11105 [Actinomycetes bacterium]
MNRSPRLSLLVVVAAAATLALTGCSKSGSSAASSAPPPPVSTSASASGSASSSPSMSGGSLVQWAVSATATTQYGAGAGESWNASNATGASVITECQDDGRAWASQEKNTVDTLTLKYATPVVPNSITVYESYNPGYVTSVSVSGGGQNAVVYTGVPAAKTPCPTTLVIPVSSVKFKVDTVAVTVDQTKLENWAEIDAVRLSGTP